MSLKIFHPPKLTVIVLFVTITMFLPILCVSQPARSQTVATGSALREVHLRMKADGLTPISPPEDETVRKKSIPSGFESGLTKWIGRTVYKKVGTWELDNIADVISIQQPVIFIIWLSSSGANNGDILFTLKYGTAVVAGPTELQANNIGSSAKRYFVSSHANLTTTDSGKPLTLEIEAKINGNGVMVEYGGYQEDSGVSFLCDAVKFKGFHAGQDEFCVEFSDAFRAPVNSLYPLLFVDDNAIYDEEKDIIERGKSDIGNNLFEWKVPLTPGDHTFLVGIAYSRNKDINLTWNTQVVLNVRKEDDDRQWFANMDFGNMMAMFFLGVGLLVFLISTFAILSARSSQKNLYARRSPIPDRYRLIVNKRMNRFQNRPRPTTSSAGRTRNKRSFRARKKIKK